VQPNTRHATIARELDTFRFERGLNSS